MRTGARVLSYHYCDVRMGVMASQIRRSSERASNLRVTGLCDGNSLGDRWIPLTKASDAENVSIWWHHHFFRICHNMMPWHGKAFRIIFPLRRESNLSIVVFFLFFVFERFAFSFYGALNNKPGFVQVMARCQCMVVHIAFVIRPQWVKFLLPLNTTLYMWIPYMGFLLLAYLSCQSNRNIGYSCKDQIMNYEKCLKSHDLFVV